MKTTKVNTIKKPARAPANKNDKKLTSGAPENQKQNKADKLKESSSWVPAYPRIYVRSPPHHRRYNLYKKRGLEPLIPAAAPVPRPANGIQDNSPKRQHPHKSKTKSVQKVLAWECQKPVTKKAGPSQENNGAPEEQSVAAVSKDSYAAKSVMEPQIISGQTAIVRGVTATINAATRNQLDKEQEQEKKTPTPQAIRLLPLNTGLAARTEKVMELLRSYTFSKDKLMEQAKQPHSQDVLTPVLEQEPPRPRLSPVSMYDPDRAKTVTLSPKPAKFDSRFNKIRVSKAEKVTSINDSSASVVSTKTKKSTQEQSRRRFGHFKARGLEKVIKISADGDDKGTRLDGSYRRNSRNVFLKRSPASVAFITPKFLPPFEEWTENSGGETTARSEPLSSRRDSEGGYSPDGSSGDSENDPMIVRSTNAAECLTPRGRTRRVRLAKFRQPLFEPVSDEVQKQKKQAEEQEIRLRMLDEYSRRLQALKGRSKAYREWNNSTKMDSKSSRSRKTDLQAKLTDSVKCSDSGSQSQEAPRRSLETPLTKIYGAIPNKTVCQTYKDRRMAARNQVMQNGHLYSSIKNARTVYPRDKQLQDFKRHQALVAAKMSGLL